MRRMDLANLHRTDHAEVGGFGPFAKLFGRFRKAGFLLFNTEPHFCLIDERARIVREMAFIIQRDYDSSFDLFVQKSKHDCVKLVEMIVSSFSGFRDEAIFKGKQVFFYKRAQILVSDLIGAYQDYS